MKNYESDEDIKQDIIALTPIPEVLKKKCPMILAFPKTSATWGLSHSTTKCWRVKLASPMK